MDNLITELLELLRPVLKSRRRAKQLLDDYWADRIALIWTTQQVHRAANEKRLVLTEAEARDLLRQLHLHHNPQYGLRWSDVAEHIQQNAQGRDIRKQELHRFLQHDVLTIAPRTRKQPCPTGAKTNSKSSAQAKTSNDSKQRR